MAEQRVVLEHQANAALARRDMGHIATVQGDAAVIDAGQPRDGAQQRALAAAAGTQQDEELAIADIDGYVVHDGGAG